MLSIIFSILAATIPLSVLHWYMASVERRPVPERHLANVNIPSLPAELRQYKIYVIMPAYIAVLGGVAFFWGIWAYLHIPHTRNNLIEVSPILLVSSLMIVVGALWFLWAIGKRITITNGEIIYYYGFGHTTVDLLDVRGYTERPSFIFVHFKTARKNLAIPTSFQGLDLLLKVLDNAQHGRSF
jgi:hypothetical protein